MAAVTARRSGVLTRRFTGPRIGTTMMVLGVVLATAAAVLVLILGRRVRATAAAAQTVSIAYVVMVTRDVPEATRIPADAVAVKPFPAAFVPAGATTTAEEVVGKFATTRLTRDQIVLTAQISPTRRGANLSEAIPPGKVAYWMPVPDLPAQTGGLRAGDRVDILLSLTVPPPPGQPADQARGITTQMSLQNVEIFFIGTSGAEAAASNPAGQTGQAGGAAAPPGTRVAVVLLDPQEAVQAKFIKDSGGTVDVVLRSRESTEEVATEAVTIDSFADRFRFRMPGQPDGR
ncbi:MAG: Flp pilus assembly protein CpaB [Chloroflexota bacterium]